MLREAESLGISTQSDEVVIRTFCFFGRETAAHFRVRPALPEPGDEFLLELAVAGNADAIITHNYRPG